MKKLLLFIVLFVSFLYAADSTAVIPADTNNADLSKMHVKGVDVGRYVMFDNTEDTGDTIASDDFVVMGPFPLGFSNEAAIKSMNFVGTNLASGDSLVVWYQLAGTDDIADTSSAWVAWGDTLGPTGLTNSATLDLSTLTGDYMWVRFQNQTASAVVVPDYQWLYYKKNVGYTK